MAGIGEPRAVKLANEGRAWVSNGQCIELEQPGVYWVRQDRRWRACVRVAGVRYDFGEYRTQVEATYAYNLGYRKVFGVAESRNYRVFSRLLSQAEKVRLARKVTRRLEATRS